MNKINFIKQWINSYGNPIFVTSVEYLTYSSDYVDDKDRGFLHSLTITARTYSEYLYFFKEVARLMGTQCYAPCSTDDLRIELCPLFKVAVYLGEEHFLEKHAHTHYFIKFNDKFYNDVSKFARR